MLFKKGQFRLSHQSRLLWLWGLIEAAEEDRWLIYNISPEWKKHRLVMALKKSLPPGPGEKEAVVSFFPQTLRRRRMAHALTGTKN